MNYKKLFDALLMEEDQTLPGGGRTYPDGQQAFNDTLDDGTDESTFHLTQGLVASVEAVQQDFNKRMTSFAQSLSPETIKTLTLSALKDKISRVFKYVNGIQVFAKAKIDTLASNPSAILAAFIASDPAKQSAFENLHKKLEDFQKTLEETEASLSTLKGNIDDFVHDVAKGDIQKTLQQASNEQEDALGAGPEESGRPPTAVNTPNSQVRR
jgi:hypothetical protein